MDFTDKLRLRGQAEEDLYFAELDRQLIEAMHERQKQEENKRKTDQSDDPKMPSSQNK
ncbi:hypothetical protein VA7868_03472 [Vibrio aerogenes CECT 7868]|uniref:Uncharacterized protein n=1 Tax=Vibrio aerogenes CECT 7868 TaxID=1216006 RepID=A0A1M6A580_9VIBR|nr:hypothetical protein [Vibrio aerogenes]SHI31343.1 hypothetical protein VA7868_03472 [Vibrio aerogenes CECT 7868]